MTSAGYIHDQRCPGNPSHGNVVALDSVVYCPHQEHDTPGSYSQSRWSWAEWESVKTGVPLNPPKSQPTAKAKAKANIAIPMRKPRAGSKNRRRSS